MDIHSKNMDPIFEELSQKYGLSKITIKMIVRSQFEFVKHIMKKVDSYNKYWPSIRLPMWCVFKVKKGRQKFFNDKSEKTIEDVYNQGQ